MMTDPHLAGYTAEEEAALREAARLNCSCEYDADVRTQRCVMCALIEQPSDADQRWINGLLFMRRKQLTLKTGEGI